MKVLILMMVVIMILFFIVLTIVVSYNLTFDEAVYVTADGAKKVIDTGSRVITRT